MDYICISSDEDNIRDSPEPRFTIVFDIGQKHMAYACANDNIIHDCNVYWIYQKSDPASVIAHRILEMVQDILKRYPAKKIKYALVERQIRFNPKAPYSQSGLINFSIECTIHGVLLSHGVRTKICAPISFPGNQTYYQKKKLAVKEVKARMTLDSTCIKPKPAAAFLENTKLDDLADCFLMLWRDEKE